MQSYNYLLVICDISSCTFCFDLSLLSVQYWSSCPGVICPLYYIEDQKKNAHRQALGIILHPQCLPSSQFMLVLVLCLLLIFNFCWSIGFSAKLTFVFLFEPLILHLDPKTNAKHMDVIFLLFASTLYQGSHCYSPLMSLPPPHISINGILFLPLEVTSQLGKV